MGSAQLSPLRGAEILDLQWLLDNSYPGASPQIPKIAVEGHPDPEAESALWDLPAEQCPLCVYLNFWPPALPCRQLNVEKWTENALFWLNSFSATPARLSLSALQTSAVLFPTTGADKPFAHGFCSSKSLNQSRRMIWMGKPSLSFQALLNSLFPCFL